jgi:ABC-type Mn2+/Zn2+ transport system permease subunit
MRTIDFLLHYAFFREVLIAAIAVATLCSLLSVIVVLKRMAFIGQGISHAGFGGVGLAVLLGVPVGMAQDAVVMLFCLGTGLVIGVMSQRRRIESDTAIGVILAGSMAAGALCINLTQTEWYALMFGAVRQVSFESVLFGSVLNVGRQGMWLTIVATVAVLGVCAALFKELLFFAFDETGSRVFGVRTGAMHFLLLALLTVTIVVSMKLMGVILVTALLVIPGATALQLSDRLGRVLLWAWVIGVSGVVGGLVLSMEADLSSGASMAAVMGVMFAAVTGGRALVRRVRA